MNKLLIALTIALLAIPTLFGASAEAGHGRHRGFHNVFHHLAAIERAKRANAEYRREQARRAAQIRAKRKAAYAAQQAKAAKAAKAAALAKAEAQAQAEAEAKAEVAAKDIQSQNSSITTADGEVAAAKPEPKAEKVATAEDLGCKQFFPSVGLTLTVPCE